MLRDVSRDHGTWRVDANTAPYHHLLCTRCHSITELDIDLLEPVKLQGRLPSGFRLEKFNVEVQGVCKGCNAATKRQS